MSHVVTRKHDDVKDSFVSGFAYCFLTGCNSQESVELAMAHGA